ncbi:MAG: C40 family peptidase [Actinomycetota bacterium]|nr:C40 family peptidase [Actinomycetota bacterium]
MKTIARVVAACVAGSFLLIAGPALAFPTGVQVAAHQPEEADRARQHIEERARSQVGAPYSYGGTSPSGFDCSGFTRWVYLDHGANLPHSSSAQFELAGNDGYRRIWDRGDLHVGDLVFHDTGSGRVGHAGIYIGGGRFISATSSEGVQVRSLYDSYWGPRWVGATRVPATMD